MPQSSACGKFSDWTLRSLRWLTRRWDGAHGAGQRIYPGSVQGPPSKRRTSGSWARPTTGIAQFSLLEELTGRTLALLLQGICRPDRLSRSWDLRLFLRQSRVKAIRKRRLSQSAAIFAAFTTMGVSE